MPHQPPQQRPQTAHVVTGHVLNARSGQWPALRQAALQIWHQQLHARVGRQRVVHVRLQLGVEWPVPDDRLPVELHFLASRLGDVAPLDVLAQPQRTGAYLMLSWAPWHAPPTEADIDNPPALPSLRAITTEETTMRFPFFSSREPADPILPSSKPAEPRLSPPLGERTAASPGRNLSQALARIADHIHDAEVRDLRELDDTTGCRYQLQQLVFSVGTTNQGLLRGLMVINQRDPALARLFVERGFAQAEGAKWINTRFLKLEFRRDESLPGEPTEVLLSNGRETEAIRFGYDGQVELAPGIATPRAQATACMPSAVPIVGPNDLRQPRTTDADLVVWMQQPNQSGLLRWGFASGPVRVGAADDADVRVDHSHVSGEHLVLVTDSAGRWHVEDRSRNGTQMITCKTESDAVSPLAKVEAVAENPLPARRAQALPEAGALRLGPLAEDPLLHFVLRQRVPSQAVTPPDGRRQTRFAVAPAARQTEMA